MPGTPYSEEQRTEALRLYVEEGPDIAAQQTKISVRTIYRWASAEGVSTTATSERTHAATTAAKERARMLRAELRALLTEQAVKTLHALDGSMTILVRGKKGEGDRLVTIDTLPASDKKDLALTAAVLIDKMRLEEGEATGRTESTLLQGRSDHEQRILADLINRELEGRADAHAPGDQEPDPVAQPETAESGTA